VALLQISEPGQSAAPHQHRLAIGIDLGTTNSLVASVRSGVADVLPATNGDRSLASVVTFRADGGVDVGEAAASAESVYLPIRSAKRLMGKGADDLDGHWLAVHHRFDVSGSVPAFETAAGPKTPVAVSAEILSTLKSRAENTLGGELAGAVITVPAYFDDAQRQATKDAAALAGLSVLRLLNEPTAAAVAYGLDQGDAVADGSVVAIYDLGGGSKYLPQRVTQRSVVTISITCW